MNYLDLRTKCLNMNELFRLENKVSDMEHEKARMKIKQEKKREEENIKNVIDVMNYVKNLHYNDPNTNNVSTTCRKRSTFGRPPVGGKRRRTDMDFLTPRTSKTGEKLIDKADESPIIWPVPLLTEKVCDVGGQLVRLIERNYAVRL